LDNAKDAMDLSHLKCLGGKWLVAYGNAWSKACDELQLMLKIAVYERSAAPCVSTNARSWTPL
jgi:hypothetical protein